MATDDRLYFRQLLSGRDFAVGDPIASQMVNFVYAIGDRTTGECVLVDPAYAVDDLVDAVEADGMTVGGVAGHALPPGPHRRLDDGPHDRGRRRACSSGSAARSTCRPTRRRGSARSPGIAESELATHHSGDTVTVGGVDDRAAAHAGPHAGQPVHPRRRPARLRRHAVPRRLRAHRPARAAIPSRCTRACSASPPCPPTPSCSPATATRCRRAPRWTAIRESNYVFRPRSKDQWMMMFGH